MTVYSSKIVIEQEDAASFEDQEEVKWSWVCAEKKTNRQT